MATVFFAAATSHLVRRVFEARLLRGFGLISFSAYLTHYFVTAEVARWQWLPTTLGGVVVIALTALIAGICYCLIERPTVRLGGRIATLITRGRVLMQNRPAAAESAR